MDIKHSSLAPQTGFGNSALIVSPDDDLADKLKSFLGADHRCDAKLAAGSDDAIHLLVANGVDSVFIDMRPQGLGKSPMPLLQFMQRQEGSLPPVFGLTEGGYPLELAEAAHAVIQGHVDLPLSRQKLAALATAEPRRLVANAANGPLKDFRSVGLEHTTCTPHLAQHWDELVRLARHHVTLLLVGETGTGKTMTARLIHELSPQRGQIFVTVACAALPPTLIESELFGHVKGAFTGADRNKIGKFEVAESGTLLLDEIDTLGPDQQAKLLRVIETGEFEPVGSNEVRRSKTRLIVATNVDLKSLVAQGKFRSDLYYRLNVLEFRIPPLRERPWDITPLVLGFVGEFCQTHGVDIRRIDPDFLAKLEEFHWPGNVRELKNHIRRAVLYCKGHALTTDDLAPALCQAMEESNRLPLPAMNGSAAPNSLFDKVAASERKILVDALRANNYNRTATAKSLGISRVGLYKKMRRYGMLEANGDEERE